MAKNRALSTFEREMRDPVFRAGFEREAAALEVSEFIAEKMAEQDISVRKLAALCKVSSTVIQGIKSGSRKNIGYNTLRPIVAALGYKIVFKEVVKRRGARARV